MRVPYRQGIVLVLICGWCTTGRSQTITVQQPVVRQFSVQTAVSVPDRGAIQLGGVGRAADSRSRFGPIPSGTSTGLSREHAAASTHVWIHDLRAMDEAVLERAERTTSNRQPSNLDGYAAHARDHLLARHRKTQAAISGPSLLLQRRTAPHLKASRRSGRRSF